MAINFPNSPVIGDTHVVNNTTYEWDGTSWSVKTTSTQDLDTIKEIKSGQAIQFWLGTVSEYEALGTYNNSVVYLIEEV
jgi:hypothetical protein